MFGCILNVEEMKRQDEEIMKEKSQTHGHRKILPT